MNKAKKEEIRKHNEARNGLNTEQILELDKHDAQERLIEELAQTLHGEIFHEEYDFYGDSIQDVSDRKKGINPMSNEHIEKVAKKRSVLGVSPLSDAGLATSFDAKELCHKWAKKTIEQLESKTQTLLITDYKKIVKFELHQSPTVDT